MLRSLTKSDLGQILAIEESVQAVPWSEETFRVCFQAGYIGWVIDLNKEVIGFIIVSERSTECHILNVCVARPYQHKGFGRQLLEYVIQTAAEKGIAIAYLEVRRSNSKAISLYEKMDFYLVGERKDYYPAHSGKEDALIFVKDLLGDRL